MNKKKKKQTYKEHAITNKTHKRTITRRTGTKKDKQTEIVMIHTKAMKDNRTSKKNTNNQKTKNNINENTTENTNSEKEHNINRTRPQHKK